MKKLAGLFLLLAASGCPDIKVDENETGPLVEFDPGNRIIPFPNNLLLNPLTGKVNLPAQCGETPTAKALRENVLNQLDGFGLFEATQTVGVTEQVDLASLTDRVVIYKRSADLSMATSIPFEARMGASVRFDADCSNPRSVPQLAITPYNPDDPDDPDAPDAPYVLEPGSSYVVALLEGIQTADGRPFNAAGAWRLVRDEVNPVTIVDGKVVADRTPLDPSNLKDLDQLKGINLLWQLHEPILKLLSQELPMAKRLSRDQILLAWEFKTQTSVGALDPMVTGSPAQEVVTNVGLLGNLSQTAGIDRGNLPYSQCPAGDNNTQCFLKIALGRGNYAVGNATCQAVGCAAIADVVGSALGSKQYQIDTPNPYTGTGTKPIPGPWAHPNDPAEVKTETISALSLIPAMAMPAGGYPVVVFQHAIGQSKTTALAIAGRLAAAGFLTVAIDAVGHDSRAVRISTDAALGCANAGPPPMCARPDCGPSPVDFPQCYAPFLSPNLGATRDGIRQTVVDNLRLIAALKVCGTTQCGAVTVDPTKILYLGQSLGGIIGSMTAAISPDVKAAVLNVPGVGWADILENTGTLRLQCLLVDGLIDAGILQGEKSNLMAMPPTGLCTKPDDWKNQPGYRQFSVIGRWVLDPADPANFTGKLAVRRFLIQQVVGDTVIPNLATTNQGMLVGLTAATADPSLPPPPPAPSAAITTNPTASKWVRYPTLPPDGGTGFPGNTFHHGSLLSPTPTPMPPPPPPAGALATARMQVDALTFLSLNQ